MKIQRFLLSLFLISGLNVAWANPPTIVVAANMKPAMEDIYQQYKTTTGQEFRIIYDDQIDGVAPTVEGYGRAY